MEKKYRLFLTLTAFFEGTTGVALVIAPDRVVSLLLDTTLTEPGGIIATKLAGSALLSLTIICWLYRIEHAAAVGIIKGMSFYNLASALLLIYAWSGGFTGMALWPAVLLHIGMAIWSIKTSFLS